MTYVGAVPTTGDFKKLDSITTSSATTFNLRQGGVAVYPQSANHCIVSLNGVIQAPVDAFTIVNDTIVFASSLASSDVINFILVQLHHLQKSILHLTICLNLFRYIF